MEYQEFEGQMRRLAASYRVDVTASTIAAYWTVFAGTDAERFAAACAKSIEHERSFPTPAALKEIIRLRHEIGRSGPSLASAAGSVGCPTCMDAGFVRRDLPAEHPEFGALLPCPHCEGARKPRHLRAEALASVAREHREVERLRPYREGREAERAATHARQSSDGGPPEGFARAGVPVPTMVSEEQRQATRTRLRGEMAALNERMRMVKTHGA